MRRTDFLVAGAGIVGISVARELRRRHPGARIVVLEKESAPGQHASGRNSGVLHAGFYYSPDSLKARFTRDGNAALQAFCLEQGLPLRRCGKLVVARDDGELQRLDALHARGLANGVELRRVDAAEARSLEPRARVHERAIFSPTTASIDPVAVVDRMAALAAADGVEFRYEEAFAGADATTVRSTRETWRPRFFVSAAGLQADTVAHAFGLGRRYRILPFRGRYLTGGEAPGGLRVHVYPVPDPQWPFLGVHCTVTVAGQAKLGPTAFPALWREHYGGLANFSAGELLRIGARDLQLLVRSRFGFARLAWRELRTSSRTAMVREAARLVTGLRATDPWVPARPGIRAQLLDLETGTLVSDFVAEADARSLHVLNAVSPAFTCALPFAAHLVDRIDRALAASAG
ncbi:MAG: L-2-hydroxyglutarate oxidase [Nevskiaceae bacterium]